MTNWEDKLFFAILIIILVALAIDVIYVDYEVYKSSNEACIQCGYTQATNFSYYYPIRPDLTGGQPRYIQCDGKDTIAIWPVYEINRWEHNITKKTEVRCKQ